MKGKLFLLAGALAAAVHAGAPEPSAQFSSEAKGHIFAAEAGKLTLRLSPPARGGEIKVLDEKGKTLSSLPISAGASEVTVPLENKGFYRLRAAVDFGADKPVETEVTAAVIGPELGDAARKNSRIGLWTVQGDPELARLAGANWNRLMTTLKDYDEATLDKSAADLPGKRNDIGMFTNVGVISFGLPMWIFDPAPAGYEGKFYQPFQKPKDWGRLSDLVRAFVRQHPRWSDFPPYFEVYNEPEWHWKGSQEDLIEFEKTVADAIRKERPDVKILGPGFSSIRIKDSARIDLETAERLGLFDHLDGIVVHAYVDGSAPEGQFVSRVRELQDFLKRVGKPDFPIHLTEFGWCTQPGTWQRPVSELEQAQYAVRSLTMLAALGVENSTYFCLLYKAAPNAGEGSFSIIHNDLTPKPAYASFSNTARWLAGVKGKGRWLQLTPTTYLIVFRKEEHDIAVAWDTATERTLAFSEPGGQAEDFVGRPVRLEGGGLAISPSPLFLELDDRGLYDVEMADPIQVMRGNSQRIPGGGDGWVALSPLTVKEGVINPPPDAPEGIYMLLARMDGRWKALPVEVVAPLQVSPVRLSWPVEEAAPRFTAALKSHAAVNLTAYPSVKLEKTRTLFGEPVQVEAGASAEFTLPMENFQLGKRYRGVFAMEAREGEKADRVEQPLDFTLVSAQKTVSAGKPDWKTIPAIDFTNWDPFGEASGPEDCSATMQAAYDARALYLRVRVRDDEHLQEKNPEALWNQDSIQIGFDVDVQKTWEANDLFGLKGHRVFEYGVAWNGKKPMNWRWISYLPELPVGRSDDRIGVRVRRESDVTEYDLVFPWEVLGCTSAPTPGSAVGLSLAVTDADTGNKGGRHGLRLFGGITDGKDPEKFGELWLR